ncbi:MAG TPA: hypothetical protein VHN11_16105 [Xanthobacteraceae bacterium]|jgi:hypothetical protein|nr:hypothetical protein [Xanthobacteraceae bacterium]
MFDVLIILIGGLAGFVFGHVLGDPFMALFFGKEWYLRIKTHRSLLIIVTTFVLGCAAIGAALASWIASLVWG